MAIRYWFSACVSAMGYRLSAFVADIVAPRICVGCGSEGAWLCVPCAAGVERELNVTCIGCGRLSRLGMTCDRCSDDLPITGAVAIASYRNSAVRRIVQAVKYASAHDVAGAFAPLVTAFLKETEAGRLFREQVGATPVLVPVPLRWKRRVERGFNQSEHVATALAGAGFGVVAAGVLARRWRWRAVPQVELSHAERFANVAGIFACRNADALRGHSVVIVDDVVTTGATISACARAIRDAGVRSPIWGFALARG